jgi:methionyl-tRNA synthetase
LSLLPQSIIPAENSANGTVQTGLQGGYSLEVIGYLAKQRVAKDHPSCARSRQDACDTIATSFASSGLQKPSKELKSAKKVQKEQGRSLPNAPAQSS